MGRGGGLRLPLPACAPAVARGALCRHAHDAQASASTLRNWLVPTTCGPEGPCPGALQAPCHGAAGRWKWMLMGGYLAEMAFG